jgi:hypothetical protein
MFWNILFFIIGSLFLIFLIRCLSVYLVQRRGKKSGLVCLPNFFPLIGGTGGGLFLPLIYGLLVFTERTSNNIWGMILCSILFLLSLSIMIVWHNRTIQYDSQKFISRNFFGKKRVFSYRDITGYNGDRDVILFCRGKKVVVDKEAYNSDLFLDLVKERYRSLHQGQEIPLVKSKFDPFNGHVENSSQIFAFYIAILIFLLASWALCIPPCLKAVNEDTAHSFTSSFARYQIKGTELTLYPSAGFHPFVIRNYDKDILDEELLFSLCDSQTEFSIYAELISPSDRLLNNEPFYLVHSLTGSDGHTFLPLEHAINQQIRRIVFVCLFFGLSTAFWIIFIICSIVIGRNPQKYSWRMVHFFFRDNPLHY